MGSDFLPVVQDQTSWPVMGKMEQGLGLRPCPCSAGFWSPLEDSFPFPGVASESGPGPLLVGSS